jgi:LEA14-like dessication related protein
MERIRPPLFLLATLVLVACLLQACGPQVIKGRPPFVGLSSLELVEDRLSAVFDISNQNGVPMTIDRIQVTVRVNEVELAGEDRELRLAIDANSTEEVRVEELPDSFTRDLLASLEGGEVNSIPFDLNGRVTTVEDGVLRFEYRGHLYPVPGRPGQFRSAVTQARELQREDDF